MLQVMNISLQKVLPHSVPLTLQQVTADPCLCPETPGHSLASPGQSLVGLLLLAPVSWCVQSFVCALQESVSTVLCSSSGSMVGLMVTSSQRAYATPRSDAPRAPAPVAGQCRPIPPQETQKHSKAGLAQSLWGLLVHSSFSLSPPSLSGLYGV